MKTDERRALVLVCVTGTAVLVLAMALFAVRPKTSVRANVDGLQSAVIGFELASTPEQVLGILGGPDDPARAAAVRAMNLTNRIDFLFMVAYPALSVAIAMLLVARRLASGWLLWVVGGLALAMFAGDSVENLQLLVLSRTTDPAEMAGPLAVLRVAAWAKWMALFVTALLEGVFVWCDVSGWRWSSLFFVGAGVLGLLGFVWLVAIEHAAKVVALAWLWTWVWALWAALVAGRSGSR